jgi:glycosyltransferase involved in cell wall biosynthesis
MFNKYTFTQAKQVIIIGRDMKKWFEVNYSQVLNKINYIPIWQDGNIIKPLDLNKNSFIRVNNLSSKFIVQYSGNMGLWNDMVTFGKAINQINDQDIQFTFIGDGIRKNELVKSLNQNANIQFFPFQPKSKLNVTLSACHIALVSLNRGLEGIAVPSKIMGILAAGIATIALVPKDSEIALIINDGKCGIVIDPGDVKGLIHSIKLLKENDSLRIEMGQNARNVFLEKFDIKVIANQYIQLIKK